MAIPRYSSIEDERALYEARERAFYEDRERRLRDQYLTSHLVREHVMLNPLEAGCSHCVEQRPMPAVSKVVLLCR